MIKGFDHVAIPMQSVEAMLEFYSGLGGRIEGDYSDVLYSIYLGNNKINLHVPAAWKSEKFTLRGKSALPGCGDLCFEWDGTMQELYSVLGGVGAEIEEGPVERVGGKNNGAIGTSVYTRDPDFNLLEFIVYSDEEQP